MLILIRASVVGRDSGSFSEFRVSELAVGITILQFCGFRDKGIGFRVYIRCTG